MLRSAGHRVSVAREWTPATSADVLLALHARRSHASLLAFRALRASCPILLALTGTDVYRDIHASAEARESLRLADRFIVLQPRAIDELDESLRHRASTVYQSCASRLRHQPVRRGFRVCVIGHLREEKDPLRALEALAYVPPEARIEVVQLGGSLDRAIERAARAGSAREPRYRWLGSVPHARALGWLASSHAMVISSRMEGGANVISEAARIGVPVLASRISGNIGLLGNDYPAYYPPCDERALAALMMRAAGESVFYDGLRERMRRLRPLVAPSNEARLLLAAIKACTGANERR